MFNDASSFAPAVTPWIRVTRLLQQGEVKEYFWELIRPGARPALEGNGAPDEMAARSAAQRRADELGLGQLRVEPGADGIWVGKFH
jgi:hypothetical protein